MSGTVLITGARAATALSLAFTFRSAGWRVIGADRPRFAIGRFAAGFDDYVRTPPPRWDSRGFVECIEAVVQHHAVTLIVPTCEETFFLAAARERLSSICDVAFPPLSQLRRLHDKSSLSEMASGLGVGLPESFRVENARDLVLGCDRFGPGIVLKPAFSRFAARTIIDPTAAMIAQIRPTPDDPWVCQRKIIGDEVCTYAVSSAGRLTAFCAYRPLFRIGNGGGLVLERIESRELEAFCVRFAERHQFDGQFSFDLIQSLDEKFTVIECNPRATSGLHFLADQKAFASCFGRDGTRLPPHRAGREPLMVASSMVLSGLPYALRSGRLRAAWSAWSGSTDVVGKFGGIGGQLGQLAAIGEALLTGAITGVSPHRANTDDIEWDGAPIRIA